MQTTAPRATAVFFHIRSYTRLTQNRENSSHVKKNGSCLFFQNVFFKKSIAIVWNMLFNGYNEAIMLSVVVTLNNNEGGLYEEDPGGT